MEKLKILDSPWNTRIDSTGCNADVRSTYKGKWVGCIHGAHVGNNVKEFQALIPAITAVPEMIAALENVVRWWNNPKEDEPLDMTSVIIALRKAKGRG
jgi:hypothetical protein